MAVGHLAVVQDIMLGFALISAIAGLLCTPTVTSLLSAMCELPPMAARTCAKKWR